MLLLDVYEHDNRHYWKKIKTLDEILRTKSFFGVITCSDKNKQLFLFPLVTTLYYENTHFADH